MQYLLTLLLLVSSFIFSSEEEAKECADIEDTSQRLTCYDSFFAPQQIEDPKLVITQKKQEAEIAKQDKEIKKEVKKERERRFGLPKRLEKEEDKIEITDKILEVKRLADLRLDVILENGQKWRSVEKIRQVRLKANQKVIISEGFISGYILKVVDKKISIRVRRIK